MMTRTLYGIAEADTVAKREADGARQRAIAERLLLAALKEQDAARAALEASGRSAFLASASRDLAASLDQDATRTIIQRLALPRDGSWCMVELVEADGAIHRLTVLHPDPEKQKLARELSHHWVPRHDDSTRAPAVNDVVILTPESGEALLAAAPGKKNLKTLLALGFGQLLVVPLIVRSRRLGSIAFASPAGSRPFLPEEIALAEDLSNRCAMALDNARLYHEADELRRSADAANNAKSAFLGTMSHELRTPLNVIGGYAELMELGLHGPVTPEQRTDIKRIQHSQRHLLTLVTGILDFVQSEGRRLELHPTEILVRDAMDEALQMMAGAAAEKQLALVIEEGDVDCVVRADADRVRQILVNLVVNAVKYTAAGSGTITLASSASAKSVTISVTDPGPGIPPDRVDEIFEPFVQLETGLSSRQGGIGLGLSISRDLARAMDGDLTATSAVGVGSCFTLELPRNTR